MTKPQERLARQMNDRRLELRMSWGAVAEAADLSEAGIRAIRRGRHQPSDLTKRRLEDALQWAPGSIDAILAGSEPAPLPSGRPSEDERLDDVERRLQRIATDRLEAELRRRRAEGE